MGEIPILTISLQDYAASKGRKPKDYLPIELNSFRALEHYDTRSFQKQVEGALSQGPGEWQSPEELESLLRRYALEVMHCEVMINPLGETIPGTPHLLSLDIPPRYSLRATGLRLKLRE